MRTIAYDVIGVNVFLPTLMRILPKKGVNSVPPILLRRKSGEYSVSLAKSNFQSQSRSKKKTYAEFFKRSTQLLKLKTVYNAPFNGGS